MSLRPSPARLAALPPPARLKVRDALSDHLELIDAENPVNLPDHELDIVRSRRHLVAGKFYVLREPKAHAVLLSTADPPVRQSNRRLPRS